jgi:4-amino-4-deoxy-L-arabinose transferase-like glycosyltransferase
LLIQKSPRLTVGSVRMLATRIPIPLGALLAAVAMLGVCWALLLPAWQAPDENYHFGYAQLLAERFQLPGEANRPGLSTEQFLAQDWSNSDQTAAVPATKPEWSEQAYERWRADQQRLGDAAREDGTGPNPASTNPPLYYLYETPAYLAAKGGDIFDRLYLMRLWSVVLLLVTTCGAWLLAGELFGRERPLQLAAAGIAGLQPMVTFISSSVTPDALVLALWTLCFWLGVRILKRGLGAPEAVALMLVVGLGVVTKATSYALLPAALLVLTVGAVRLGREQRRLAVTLAALGLAAFVAPAGGWIATAHILDRPAVNQVGTAPGHPSPTLTTVNVRELGSYVWQFYLPKLPFQKRVDGMPDKPAYNVWLKGGWARFGWLEIGFPSVVYLLLSAFTLAVFAGAAVALGRAWRRIDWAVAAFFAVAAGALLAGLHWTEFRTLVGGTGPFNQGRYLLPLIGIMGAATAAAVSALPARWRMSAVAAVLGGLVVLQVFSLALIAGRFYA